eukprot:305729-Hanusia_phi.AAC.1
MYIGRLHQAILELPLGILRMTEQVSHIQVPEIRGMSSPTCYQLLRGSQDGWDQGIDSCPEVGQTPEKIFKSRGWPSRTAALASQSLSTTAMLSAYRGSRQAAMRIRNG